MKVKMLKVVLVLRFFFQKGFFLVKIYHTYIKFELLNLQRDENILENF